MFVSGNLKMNFLNNLEQRLFLQTKQDLFFIVTVNTKQILENELDLMKLFFTNLGETKILIYFFPNPISSPLTTLFS